MGGRFELRVDEATKDRWRDAAAVRGLSLAEFVSACVEVELLAPAARLAAPRREEAASPAGKRSYRPDFKAERKR